MPVASVTFTRNLSSPFVASYVPAPLRWVRRSPRPGSTTAVLSKQADHHDGKQVEGNDPLMHAARTRPAPPSGHEQ